jgi:hypothetical protein
MISVCGRYECKWSIKILRVFLKGFILFYLKTYLFLLPPFDLQTLRFSLPMRVFPGERITSACCKNVWINWSERDEAEHQACTIRNSLSERNVKRLFCFFFDIGLNTIFFQRMIGKLKIIEFKFPCGKERQSLWLSCFWRKSLEKSLTFFQAK